MAPAKAADAGDCCADLDNRVTQLETSVDRKGNRDISLTISGQVNRSILWYEEGKPGQAANAAAVPGVTTTGPMILKPQTGLVIETQTSKAGAHFVRPAPVLPH